ncbi:MAG: TIGR04348 family glycosyltransferase [Planctomycetaceae bacterium]|nr:TIGR04348 family glycosyltransferase [Planctomycetaceae bacterium]
MCEKKNAQASHRLSVFAAGAAVFRILIVTPAPSRSRKGNRITAERWAKILRSIGHSVQIADRFRGQRCDLMIALHALKSAASVKKFTDAYANKPVVLALTGTDLYHDIGSSTQAQESLKRASRFVLLQPHGQSELPRRMHKKVRVIYQSAEPPKRRLAPLKRVFEVCVSGHLRPVKDPFRAALASRRLHAASNIRITHLGAALSPSIETRALVEMQRNPRYHWLGNVSQARARQLLDRSQLMVLSSKSEGGANVISEALASDVPILSTRISGSIGLLGEDYPGYFDLGDTNELAELLERCENDPVFYELLRSHNRGAATQVTPTKETEAWRELLQEFD